MEETPHRDVSTIGRPSDSPQRLQFKVPTLPV
jgi:hypothetical protein